MPTGQAGKHMPRGPLHRRDFISCLGGAAAWPLAARAQPADQMRRIGVLTVFSKDDPEGQRRIAALLQRLQELGWVDGRNVRIEFRWAGGDPDQSRFYAGELVGMKPDVIPVNNALVMPLLQKETHIIPIVFVAIADPVVAGIVTNLARPGGNITGFTTGEYAIGGKRLEVLKEVAPDVARVTVILDPRQPNQVGVARSIEAAGPSFRVDVTMAGVRDGTEIERAIDAAAREPNSGLIVFASLVTNAHPPHDYRTRGAASAARDLRFPLLRRRGWVGILRARPRRALSRSRRVCRTYSQGREGGRAAGAESHEGRTGDQPQDREGTGPYRAA